MPASFTFTPEPVPDNFHWRRDKYHLTWPMWVDLETILFVISNVTSIPVKGYSYVLEEGVPNEDGEKYRHTHFAVWFMSKLNLSGSRKFDLEVEDDWGHQHVLHPNILPRVSLVQLEQIFTTYHAGSKWDLKSRKYVYTPPIQHEVMLPAEFEWNQAIMHEVTEASTLLEACIAANIRPKTVSDCEKLRAAPPPPKRYRHRFSPSTFHDIVPIDWTALHVWGPSGIGKSAWATAQFKNPCVIKPFNSVGCIEALSRRFDPKVNDGIVFDEADLRFLSREQAIALCDFNDECSFDVRFKSFELPAGIKKIFLSNPNPGPDLSALWPKDLSGAIARRLLVWHCNVATWKKPPVSPNQLLQQTMWQPVFSPATQANGHV